MIERRENIVIANKAIFGNDKMKEEIAAELCFPDQRTRALCKDGGIECQTVNGLVLI